MGENGYKVPGSEHRAEERPQASLLKSVFVCLVRIHTSGPLEVTL